MGWQAECTFGRDVQEIGSPVWQNGIRAVIIVIEGDGLSQAPQTSHHTRPSHASLHAYAYPTGGEKRQTLSSLAQSNSREPSFTLPPRFMPV